MLKQNDKGEPHCQNEPELCCKPIVFHVSIVFITALGDVVATGDDQLCRDKVLADTLVCYLHS
uniref:Uncharacterized protein n=1 Tax=Anguilla anguilla TaxID=7936 RepID=A0A0E9UNF9_ANGAN